MDLLNCSVPDIWRKLHDKFKFPQHNKKSLYPPEVSLSVSHTNTHIHSHTLTQLLTSNLILPELVHPLRIKTYQGRRLAKLIYYNETQGQNTD